MNLSLVYPCLLSEHPAIHSVPIHCCPEWKLSGLIGHNGFLSVSFILRLPLHSGTVLDSTVRLVLGLLMVRGDVWGLNGVGEAVPNMPRAPRELFLTLHAISGDLVVLRLCC